ncbi:hypothetical protein FBU59_002393 [Linderina macrospora]|uniref:Uncharacterized protein n=1 Tax=Linderina macrospora TaxID=4868 RepID=A0ACC1JBI6_9FUNG|nr:hypothetical protein FBU59_002393 [Linderina macrospora]
MCIAFWVLNTTTTSDTEDTHDLVLAFNRDEYLERPTKGFHAWEAHPNIFAPKDLKPDDESHRGSWIGVNRQGRLALLTNFREPVPHHDGKISRGALVRDFLLNKPVTPGGQTVDIDKGIREYAEAIFNERQRYDGFNLVLMDLVPGRRQAVYVTNRGAVGHDGQPGTIANVGDGGVAGLSNSTIDNPWPKVVKGRQQFEDRLKAHGIEAGDEGLVNALMDMMSNTAPFTPDNQPTEITDLMRCVFVPKVNGLRWTGVDNATVLVSHDGYGTRTTDILLLRKNKLTIAERNHYPQDPDSSAIEVSHVELQV